MAGAATYHPSAEHKDQVTAAGLPRLRSDATRCPPLDEGVPQNWLRAALSEGNVGGVWRKGDYPQLAWHKVGNVVYEARCSNAVQGWYHGYPLYRTEWPQWL